MTISTEPAPLPYSGNGSTTAFAITWKYFAKSHVVATLRSSAGVETLWVLDTDYTLTAAGVEAGGTLTATTAPATGETLVISLDPPNTQTSSLPLGGAFPSTTVEASADLAAQRDAKLEALFNRALRVPKTDTQSDTELQIPIDSSRASKFLAFDANGAPVAAAGTSANLGPVSAFVDTLLDAANADTFVQTLVAGLTAETSIASNDTFVFGDTSESKGNTVTLSNLLQNIAPYGLPVNLSLSASVGSNALTMAVKGLDGNNPSATNVVLVPFRSSTASSGTFNWRTITAALSLVISSTSTLGHNSALKQYIYWYLIDNAGTVELAASSKFFGWNGIVSTTAEGGAGAADSGTVMYSTTARSSVSFCCIALTEDTQTVAGTWASAPSAVHLAPFTYPLISFSAHKNGTDQTAVVTATDTKVTFGTEVYDNGGLFDAVTNHRWIPPPGTIRITAACTVSASVDQTEILTYVFKNGASFKIGRIQGSGTGTLATPIVVEDESNGTDYYEIFFRHSSGADRSILGTSTLTYVMASWSPQRS